MKRDKDLIREILIFAESQKSGYMRVFNGDYTKDAEPEFPGFFNGDLIGHIQLLIDAGYLEGNYKKHGANFIMWIKVDSITMKGYDLLDTIRDQGIWAEVKKELGVAGESWSIEMLAKLGTRALAKKLGL